ncbi:MAG TPA: PTS fructose transporter subunit IIA [Lachnospiraceae bacterium]|nr:PTS fructose transporter subunit IIA [Lachnospiraceae bacterium]
MKYVVLVSHGMFAPGLHSALDMLAGESREDILSVSLENGMSSEVYAENLRKRLEAVTEEDEILLLGDLVGGSPLTTATNIIAERGLLKNTVVIGGMSLPLALSAVLSKDSMGLRELADMLIPESREELKEFQVVIEDSEDEI